MSDFRGAHGTLASLALLAGASFFGGSSSPTSSSSSSSFLRSFALPIAWTSIVYVLVFGRYSRILERRFGTSRFVQIFIFLGGCSSLVAQSLFTAILLPQFLSPNQQQQQQQQNVGQRSTTATAASLAFSIPHWNPLLIALGTFAALRLPTSRRAASTINNSIIRNFVYPYFPVALSTLSVFANQMMQANQILGGGGGYSHRHQYQSALNNNNNNNNNLVSRVALSTLCSFVPGVIAGAALHFYQPLLGMLNSIADHPTVQSVTDTILRSGRNEVYVVQQAAVIERQQRAQEFQNQAANNLGGGGGGGDGARNLLHGDTEEEQMRQALIASIRQQRQQQQQQGGKGGAAAASSSPAPARSTTTATNTRGNSVASAAAAASSSSQQQQQQRPMSQQEKESIQFLKDMTGDANADENHLLGVLRSAGGDANQAATILLGM